MANIASQEKRIHRAERERAENRRYTSSVKTYFRRLEDAVAAGDDDRADTEHRELVSLIDRAVKRGALHRNTGARKKSRAARAARRRRAPSALATRSSARHLVRAQLERAPPRTFSSRCVPDDVPGIGIVFGELWSSQASATWPGVASCACAISSSGAARPREPAARRAGSRAGTRCRARSQASSTSWLPRSLSE